MNIIYKDTYEDDSDDKEIITNEGAGLPSSYNGIYNVNFNDATHVKYVRDQAYYVHGCPTEGDVRVLVIPVEFVIYTGY
jgi:hypothetical protein